MDRYRIKKIGQNTSNPLSGISVFGDTEDFFEGYSYNKPTVGERFVLLDRKLGNVVISTSPVVRVEKNKITTTYSIYSIEKC